MDGMNSKISRLIREELSSVKMMILAIMMSFGLVLAIANFMVNMFNSIEMANGVKGYMASPYDVQNNEAISMLISFAFVIQIVAFFVGFIPLVLMALGVYLIYVNAKNDDFPPKVAGLKVVGGVMKYHGVVTFIYVGLFAVLGIAAVVLCFGFGDSVAGFFGVADAAFVASLRVLSVVLLISLAFVGVIYIAVGSAYMSLAGSIKSVAQSQLGKRFDKLSAFGIFAMLLAGANNLLSIFSDFSGSGMSLEDIEMMEEMLGGQVTQIIVDMMPSATTQFETLVVSCAYAFFIGAAQVIGAVILLMIRSKINRVTQEQEFRSYGGDDFIGGN